MLKGNFAVYVYFTIFGIKEIYFCSSDSANLPLQEYVYWFWLYYAIFITNQHCYG